MNKMTTVNNRLILEAYKGSGKLESKVKSGFATVKQKDTLVGLKVLADGYVNIGKDTLKVTVGQKVFFSEEVLYAYDWAKKTYNLEGSETRFIIAESVHAVAVGDEA